MAHEVEIINGVAQMAYRSSKGKPWHGLGTPVDDDMTPFEIMKVAGLDWTVSKADTFAKVMNEDETFKYVPTGSQALIRDTDGKVLTEVGPNWNPVQNIEAFEFFTDFVDTGSMVMDTAGSLKGGRIVWALADLKDGFTLFGGDEMKGYLLFSNPHMYGKSVDVRFCMERVVCNNTLTMALNEKGQPSVKVNHRSHFDSERVKEVLGMSHQKIEKFKEAAEFLGSKRYIKSDLETYFSKLFGESAKDDTKLSRTAETVMDLVELQPGTQYQPGTWWQAFNAVTYATDHKLCRSADTRLTSAWFGSNAKRKIDALDLALEMAAAA
jgi:phage/plasmid-like protein (TIGR03299 family)